MSLNVYQQGPDGEFTFLPYDLPVGAKGSVKITRDIEPKGKKLPIVSMRNAIFMGLKPASVILDRDVVVHHLNEHDSNGKLVAGWMSTMPQEIEQHERQLARAHGDVLVGGLGLGLSVAILSENPKVRSIVVVEQNQDVIDLVWRHIPKKSASIVCDDLFKYLKRIRKNNVRFDFAFYDVWCPTGQFAHQQFVMPLRKLSREIVPQSQIECWNEDEMLGQTRVALDNRIHIEAGMIPGAERMSMSSLSDKQFNDIRRGNMDTWPFLNWMRREKPRTHNEIVEELDLYMKALKDADTWASKWTAYTRIKKS
jgi:hypothetical protein